MSYNPAYWENNSKGIRRFYNGHGGLLFKQAIKVMDVSEWQYSIDWAKVAQTDVDAAILRIGYGSGAEDARFAEYVAGCRKYGIPFGTYLFSYAYDAAYAKAEGEWVVSLLKKYSVDKDAPFFYDLEAWDPWKGHSRPTTVSAYKKIVSAFFAVLEGAGYTGYIYSGPSFTYYYLKDSSILPRCAWHAQYYWAPTDLDYYGIGWTTAENQRAWQYSSTEKVSGISGNVDMNAFTLFPYFAKYVAGTSSEPTVAYSTHVQSYGWQIYHYNGDTAGTTGKSKRLEAIRIFLRNVDGGITYRTHVQSYGWETSWASDDDLSGTTGKSKRLEAIQIELTGAAAENYDIYYRVHAQTFGWMAWAKNGESAGTANLSKRLEAIQIRLVKKNGSAPTSSDQTYPAAFRDGLALSATAHAQTYGWLAAVGEGSTIGTTGKGKRLEAIKLSLSNLPVSGGIEYQTHVQTYGWETSWAANGALSGTTGEAKRLEAVRIRLTGALADKFDVYYRAHIQKKSWLGWAKNGEDAGSSGKSLRMEALQIKFVPKGASAPGSTSGHLYS